LPRPPFSPIKRKNLVGWRAHNKRRWLFEKDTVSEGERAPFVCECTSAGCTDALSLTIVEYESAHMAPTWTAVLPGHVLSDDTGSVILRRPHFWVVELERERAIDRAWVNLANWAS
jgi:hypothetical protein